MYSASLCRTACLLRPLIQSNVAIKVQPRSISFWGGTKEPVEKEHVERVLEEQETRQRKYKPKFDGALIKETLKNAGTKTKLTTIRAYNPPADLLNTVQGVVTKIFPDVENWKTASLDNLPHKLLILNELIQELDHDISNFKLNEMRTIDDVIQYYQTPVLETTAYEDLARKQDLPENLHINLEPVRFNPETDTLHGGVNALPGQDTIVTSLKYKRKYENIKTTKEEAGFYNHYYNY